jgi:hypothetical protein
MLQHEHLPRQVLVLKHWRMRLLCPAARRQYFFAIRSSGRAHADTNLEFNRVASLETHFGKYRPTRAKGSGPDRTGRAGRWAPMSCGMHWQKGGFSTGPPVELPAWQRASRGKRRRPRRTGELAPGRESSVTEVTTGRAQLGRPSFPDLARTQRFIAVSRTRGPARN